MTLGDRYELGARIGAGDLTEVFLAVERHADRAGRRVAIKRPLKHLEPNSSCVQTLLRDAAVAMVLEAPNIAQVFEVHRSEQSPHVAMEYLSGEDLAFIISAVVEGGLEIPMPIACGIIAQAADGLHQAHVASSADGVPLGLLHRGLWPSNVIVTYGGVTKLTDFGSAQAYAQGGQADVRLSPSKLAYRAPEWIQLHDIDQRSDVYSLGLLLYELLAGRRVFRGETEASVLKSVMEQSVPPLARINGAVPGELEELVHRTIARDAEDRTTSAHELSEGIREVLRRAGPSPSEAEIGAWLTSSFGARYSARLRAESALGGGASAALAARPGAAPHAAGEPIDFPPGDRSAVPPGPQLGRSKSRLLVLGLVLLIALVVLFAAAVTLYFRSQRGVLPSDTPGGVATPQPPAAPALPQETDPTASPASLVVRAFPEGAKLLIDGREAASDLGPDGLLLPITPSSTVELVFRKEGYAEQRKTVQTPRSGTRHVYVNLQRLAVDPARGAAKQPAVPSAAGGAAEGEAAPPSAARSARREPRKSRRAASRRSARAAAGRRRRDVRKLAVTVAFRPRNARLVVDGVVRPGTSPVRVAGLSAGVHEVTVSADGFESESQRVQLDANRDEEELSFQLRREMASVAVVSSPSGATVKMDGQLQGTTPVQDLRVAGGYDASHRDPDGGLPPLEHEFIGPARPPKPCRG